MNNTLNTTLFLISIGLVLFVCGAYFITGFFKGERYPGTQTFFRSMTSGLTWRGVIWSAALPTLWLVVYYSFVTHVWLHLGRWPKFGEALQGGFVLAHRDVAMYFMVALMLSLLAVPAILTGCLLVRRYRKMTIYTLSYSASVGLAMLVMNFAPDEFLNWLWD